MGVHDQASHALPNQRLDLRVPGGELEQHRWAGQAAEEADDLGSDILQQKDSEHTQLWLTLHIIETNYYQTSTIVSATIESLIYIYSLVYRTSVLSQP